MRKSRRLASKSTAPDEELPPDNDLLALPGTWLNCLAGVGESGGTRFGGVPVQKILIG